MTDILSWKSKYLKYKNKYLELKQAGGGLGTIHDITTLIRNKEVWITEYDTNTGRALLVFNNLEGKRHEIPILSFKAIGYNGTYVLVAESGSVYIFTGFGPTISVKR
jgi:hypothetical protein